MRRIFSGKEPPSPTVSNGEFFAPPRNLFSDSSSTISSDKGAGSTFGKPRSRSSSFGRIFSNTSETTIQKAPLSSFPKEQTVNNLSPELVPIVTLLSAQSHRRYLEGVFLILKDLKSDGSPADRVWREVYGVLIGTQLALWNASELSKNGNDPAKLMEATSKPTYINFTDAQVRILDPTDNSLQESKKNIENTIVVSTTLKNRYFLQFSDSVSFEKWVSAFRLSAFEFTLLQEAYTGAFLSTRGAKLSDIGVILADKKFDYEDWVSVRFGAGMPWKRCYAVISQPTKKSKEGKKKYLGEINFYENEKKIKKSNAMATVSNAHAVYAIYPQSPVLIDTSTMIKLEGTISFGKKDTPKDTDIFVMPEKHYAVPGYDTIIRFLIPAMNAFQLYGRPKRLIANKDDPSSLLFALPTLPHIHYLQIEDILPFAKPSQSGNWTVQEWRNEMKAVLSKKQTSGYTGCGSSAGLIGALSSPAIGSAELFDHAPNSPGFVPIQRFTTTPIDTKFEPRNTSPLKQSPSTSRYGSAERSINEKPIPVLKQNTLVEPLANVAALDNTRSFSTPLEQNPEFSPIKKGVTGNTKENKRIVSSIEIQDSNYSSFSSLNPPKFDKKPKVGADNRSRLSDLSQIYDNYNTNSRLSAQFVNNSSTSFDSERSGAYNDASTAYNEYTGSPKVKKFDISNMNESENKKGKTSDKKSNDDDVLNDFYQLNKQISSLSINDKSTNSENVADDFNFDSNVFDTASASDNVFDPDYMEENDMLDMESKYTNGDYYSFSNDSSKHEKLYESSTPTNHPSHSSNNHSGPKYSTPSAPPQREAPMPVNVPTTGTTARGPHKQPSNLPYNTARAAPAPIDQFGRVPVPNRPVQQYGSPQGNPNGPPANMSHQRVPQNNVGYHRAPYTPQQGIYPRTLPQQQQQQQQRPPQNQGNPLRMQNPYGGSQGRPVPRIQPQQKQPQQWQPQNYPTQQYSTPPQLDKQRPLMKQNNSSHNKLNSPTTGGFSQFMPPNPSQGNPYAQ